MYLQSILRFHLIENNIGLQMGFNTPTFEKSYQLLMKNFDSVVMSPTLLNIFFEFTISKNLLNLLNENKLFNFYQHGFHLVPTIIR